MKSIKNFAQANVALRAYISSATPVRKYSLDRMTALMQFLGNPQNELRIIHIAGTSGKTSTSYYTAALLKEAGYRVGLTVSPHIDEVNERAQINLVPLTETEYCQKLSEFLTLTTKSQLSPSYFEVLVAFAFWLFRDSHVDYAVVEVGLGGLLDGTNVINRADKVCVITDIGLDHIEILGTTLGEIAHQKAGIIQPGNDVFMYPQGDEVMGEVQATCQSQTAHLHQIDALPTPDVINFTTLPLFQQRNFNLTLRAVEFTLNRDAKLPLTRSQILAACHTYIPGRMEVIHAPGKDLVLDGSHNEQKIGSLVESVLQRFPGHSIALLVSFGTNKQVGLLANLKLLRQLSSTVIITRFTLAQDEGRTSIDPLDIGEAAKEAGFTSIAIEPDPLQALVLLRKSNTDIGVVTGSFYLLNKLRKVLLAPPSSHNRDVY